MNTRVAALVIGVVALVGIRGYQAYATSDDAGDDEQLAAHEAKANPGQKCAGGKTLAAAHKAAAELKCFAHADVSRSPTGPCIMEAEQAFSKAFAKAEAKGGCLTTGDAAAVENAVDLCVGNIVALLPPAAPTPGGCEISNFACGGSCPTGQICSFVEGGKTFIACICHTIPTSTPTPVQACQPTPMTNTCGGACPDGLVCSVVGIPPFTDCTCVTPTPTPTPGCSFSVLTGMCGGGCPPGLECKMMPAPVPGCNCQ